MASMRPKARKEIRKIASKTLAFTDAHAKAAADKRKLRKKITHGLAAMNAGDLEKTLRDNHRL